MNSHLNGIDYFLPSAVLTNAEIDAEFPDWKIDKVAAKTGILERRIADSEEFTSTLAVNAARRLFASKAIHPDVIEYLIVCTQTPDYFLPTTACLVQDELGLRTEIGAVDVNLGCSGYIYSLGLAKGLIESGQVANVLVITAETHSKLANPSDKSTRPIFGDAATATLVTGGAGSSQLSGFTYGTDGRGGPSLVIPNGGLRPGASYSPRSPVSVRGLETNGYDMYMDGMEIFNFTLRVVPDCVAQVLDRTGLALEEIDYFVFHQANGYLIEHLRKKLGIDKSKFAIEIADVGNTGSSTIPIALARASAGEKIRKGSKIMILGFGVGLSWGGAVIEWS
ncbi:ketoacyl-ACP synthase III [Cryobacterium levicorallinum]|uniref:3-oxoacyl-[acyl-carrier-protein] synthase-3 n=1 Tax=Cryobacterium levicorallinum TaxID=995038 RepID=A0A1I3E0C0_9MICO|nr:ketoacyl-ACP synthase III [Cryobacterium levicorallinum]TFB81518.1 ketoacyl-ACP synthase III [Cryobacterium levicorallinum]GEP28563.1 3-oxoacyl-ACP synthase [Cryobacterium levicorallinum]SFH92416.1 3-oxoacyl-[acyl-carrier-protein] synthase-3 [Cryobacterium levicorallinum]